MERHVFVKVYKDWLLEMIEQAAQGNRKACEQKDLTNAARWFGELSAYKNAYIRIDIVLGG